MRRREFIFGTAGGAASWPLYARAQQATLPLIGVLGSTSPQAWATRMRAFREGLRESGYEEGRNVAFSFRWAESDNARLPELAADLVRERVAVIVVLGSTPSTLAAKAATATIPIVFRVAVDPVDLGLVASLGRPGGNLTGITTLGVEVGPKQVQLLKELVPGARTFALLVNPSNPTLTTIQSRDMLAAAKTLGLALHVFHASTDAELTAVFVGAQAMRIEGLVIGADTFFNTQNERLGALAVQYAIPTVSPYREFAVAGGLMSYGGSISQASRQAGVYTGRILKGEKPAELPVQQTAMVELVVNARTAQTLGLPISNAIRDRADEVIE